MSEWKEYVGAIALELDGREYEIVDMSTKHLTGKKLVKTMNRLGIAMGFCRGVETYEIQITAVIPINDDYDWADLDGAKVSMTPVSGNGKRTSYLNCLATEIGEKYEAENEARRDVSLLAQRRIKE